MTPLIKQLTKHRLNISLRLVSKIIFDFDRPADHLQFSGHFIGWYRFEIFKHQFRNLKKVMETNADNFKALNLISNFLVKSEKYPIALSAINMSIKVNHSLATNHAAYRLRSRIQRHLAVIERYKIRGKSDWAEYHRLSESALSDLEGVKLSGLSEWNEFSELELCGLIFMAQVMVFNG